MGRPVKGKRGFESEGKDIGSEVQAISVKFPTDVDKALRSLPNRSEYIRTAVIDHIALDQGLPPPLADRLSQMPDRTQYIQEALLLFMGLSSQTITKLSAAGDKAKAIEVAIALLEEKGLINELVERIKNESAS